jgi:hypothetical protein
MWSVLYFWPTLTKKGNGPTVFFPQNTPISNFSSSFMRAGEGPYRPFRSDVNAFKNNKNSPFVFVEYFGVTDEVGQAACTSAVTYS